MRHRDRTPSRSQAPSGRAPWQPQAATHPILALQRTIGNHATTRILSRTLNVKRDDLERDAGVGAGARAGAPDRDTSREDDYFRSLSEALDAYHQAKSSQDRAKPVQEMLKWAGLWLGIKEPMGDPGTKAVIALQKQLEAEADEIQGDVGYLGDVLSEKSSWQSKGAASQAEIAVGMAGGAAGAGLGQGAEALAIIRDRGLSDADIAAIRVYTADEFKYTNPSMADDQKWLETSGSPLREDKKLFERFWSSWKQLDDAVRKAVLAEADKKRGPGPHPEEVTEEQAFLGGGWKKALAPGDWTQMKAEGQKHGAATAKALTKLAPYDKQTYRGEQLTDEDARKRWTKGAEFATQSFYSTSRSPAVGMHFARNPPNADKPVKVFITLEQKTGRDVSALSAAPPDKGLKEAGIMGEEEVLLLPGSRIRVKDVDDKQPVWQVLAEEEEEEA